VSCRWAQGWQRERTGHVRCLEGKTHIHVGWVSSTAAQIHRLIAGKKLRRLEDGPVGGTPLHFGDEVIGQAMDAPLPGSGGWNLSRIADLALAQAAYQVASGIMWLPAMSKSEAIKLPITTVATVGQIGPYHADIYADTATGGIRGPFNLPDVKPGSVPTYPVLWSHDAKRERTLSFEGKKEARHTLLVRLCVSGDYVPR